MRLILVRHAHAHSKDEDPERHLSPHGEWEAGMIASKLAERDDVAPARIYHSGKTRAHETAEALAKGLAVREVLSEEDDLSPNADPSAWRDRLEGITEDVILVGHLPHLERLAGLLLEGDSEADPVSLGTAEAVCLVRDGEAWTHLWSQGPGVKP